MRNTTKIALGIVAIVIIIVAVASYVYLSQTGQQTTPTTLSGAGATFPQPFLNATITKYTHDIRTNLQINYQGVGSGQGISSLINKVVDFAASDAPLTASQRQNATGALHIPETIGAVTLAYNLPSIQTGLNLTGDVIAKIYLGSITNWNDAQIQSLNGGMTLPDHAITAVHRSDSSGTTRIFTKYLGNVSSTWSSVVGSGTSVQWPGGLGASGNAAVASTVNQTQYAIGYVELAYALKNAMTVAAVRNPAGNYILPSLASTTTAVQSGASGGLPAGDQDWGSVTLLNTPAAQAYPIVSFTYLLVYRELGNNTIAGMDKNKATQLVQFLWYIVHDGQQLAPALEYATLPANVVQIDETSIQSITFNGEHLPTS